MKNLKKMTKKQLKSIDGGNDYICPNFIAATCAEWCTLSPWQKEYCLHTVEDPVSCNCSY
ncbi:bacteriocin-like protein [Chryseobacterium arthrosphaerae]|uniref:bacteriocin-like protein n=1 Tax=Chryseobacterium arthrosphaerae TaxID=651561 RepID=UPI00241C3AE5|nr:hypothetical protein [Chryseobacterium arthrosphaerae]